MLILEGLGVSQELITRGFGADNTQLEDQVVSIIPRGMGLYPKLITQGYGAYEPLVHVSGEELQIYLSNVSISAVTSVNVTGISCNIYLNTVSTSANANVIASSCSPLNIYLNSGYDSVSETVYVNGDSLHINVSSVTISSSSEANLTFGGGGGSSAILRKLDFGKEDAVGPKVFGLKCFVTLNAVRIDIFNDESLEEEEILLLLTSYLNSIEDKPKSPKEDEEIFTVIQIIDTLLNHSKIKR